MLPTSSVSIGRREVLRRRGRTGEVHHGVERRPSTLDRDASGDRRRRASTKSKVGRSTEVLDVARGAGDEVVDAHAPRRRGRAAGRRGATRGTRPTGDDDVRHQRRPTPSYVETRPLARHRGSSRLRVSTIVRAPHRAGDSVEIELGELGPLGQDHAARRRRRRPRSPCDQPTAMPASRSVWSAIEVARRRRVVGA